MGDVQKKLQALSDSYQGLQAELGTAVEARQKLESQQQENTTVKKEFDILDDDANIYKQIGPVLLKQDKTEAVMSVNGRLEFIEKQIKDIEKQIQGIQEKSEKIKGEGSSSLRPPQTRSSLGAGHHLRASTDLGGFPSPLANRGIRPASEIYFGRNNTQSGNPDEMERAAQQWLADIDQYETTLEEMATATLDQDFKDELSAIEQWFRVLSEAERTAALYALLQQTTQVQIRFFIQVLQQMSKNVPMSGVLSPANFGEKDPMTQKLTDAMSKLNTGENRHSMGLGRPPPSPGAGKRNSGLESSTINRMFPDAAAAIAKQKAEFTDVVGVAPASNRNSTVGDRTSLAAPTISAPEDNSKRDNNAPPASPWNEGNRPKSSGGSWASQLSTPMVGNFNQSNNQADMVANATAMKLAALSTVNNRIQLDDVRKFRRARSSDNGPMSPGMPQMGNGNILMTNEMGQAQGMGAMGNFTSPQANGFLAADYGGGMMNNGMGALNLAQFGLAGAGTNDGHGFLGDNIDRGRSPRGRRGSSKPPEDPTDPGLLSDIPNWLRSLRLHKYTDNLKDLKWQELIELDDEGLEKRGVNALGARRKMLKVFEQVKEAQDHGKLR
ncbi:GimC, Prefoldin, chaperonin cofactor [Pyrenophora tritici-repentis]|nr:GimC Prefoldin chaperonin cofactor [Pyrenophora tritici-repentis]KAI1577602.1 GimC Prefoldin chaperonin cofactor [Pyrenophora tritici-repentis]KAI1590118.1 GimC Prefoldin chaperonin cofactor [Pyrenophora tritici-repentis]KAI1601694.1 GimC Prefoldin chaperonin cofactor [Pyrenophora tritici-repentis]PZD40541.1 GimC, Prefoldin, chaperonin cofactor [Pyrenophora tritici-repentis]